MWVALLNLEHKYGTMESLEALFKQAILQSKVCLMSSHDIVTFA